MLLAIDVGNTNIVIGVFRGETLVHSWRLTTIRERTSDELGILVTDLCDRNEIRQSDISGIVIASVVPPLTGTLVAMVTRVLRPRAAAVRAGGERRHADPDRQPVRSRRRSRRQRHRRVRRPTAKGLPIIVVDFGTATTFDAISAKGEYLGGVICPGPQVSADALFQRAAQAAAHRRAQAAACHWHEHRRRDAVGHCSGATSTWSRAWCAA